jgi:hypothetical protein
MSGFYGGGEALTFFMVYVGIDRFGLKSFLLKIQRLLSIV